MAQRTALIAGIALAVKTINPNVQILGVEPERCPSMSAAMAAGHPVKVEMPGPTLADGLAAGDGVPTSPRGCCLITHSVRWSNSFGPLVHSFGPLVHSFGPLSPPQV